MIRTALASLRSPFYRREMANYAWWVVRHGCLWSAAKQFVRGLKEAQPAIRIGQKGTDPELALRKHRFEWAERPPMESEAECLGILESMVEWIGKHPCGDGAEGWDAYSASRRAANWVIMLAVLKGFGNGFTSEYKPIARVNRSLLLDHWPFISAHLEDRGKATNNHLLTNAVAIYLMGVHFGATLLLSMGRDLIGRCVGSMFTEDGFLREGSSHYHLLYCQRFIEVLSAAQDAKDAAFVEVLREHLAKMLACADLLCENDPMPLFGDISPDLDPPATLTHLSRFNGPSECLHRMPTAGFIDSGYYRFRNERWTLFLYANPKGYVPPGSHGHDDLFGFSLYHDGKPILVDPGRATYEDSSMGRYGRSVRAHNSIAINGLGPSVVHAHGAHLPLLLPGYYDHAPLVRAKIEGGFVAVSVRHHGYGRIRSGILADRYIFLGPDRVVIEDHIDGRGRHGLEWFFHFHPAAEREEYIIEPCEGARADIRTHRGRDGRDPMGWYSARYGESVPSDAVVISERARLPIHRRFTLRHCG